MNRPTLIVTIVTAALAAWTLRLAGQDLDPQRLMQHKLAKANEILGGIAVEDYPRIRANADELLAITQRAEWQVLKHPDYLRYSVEFRRTLTTLSREAANKNIDGAALAYVQMTMSCVTCHKFVRSIKSQSPPR